MLRNALIIATLASSLASPATAHEYPIRHAGTEDAAIRTTDGWVQLSDLSFHYQHRDDPGYQLFEDGSSRVVSADGCYQDSVTGRRALKDC